MQGVKHTTSSARYQTFFQIKNNRSLGYQSLIEYFNLTSDVETECSIPLALHVGWMCFL